VGDRIIAADGAPLAIADDLRKLTAENPGRQIAYTVARTDGRTRIEQILKITAASQATSPDGKAILGIVPGDPTRPAKIPEAVWAGVRNTGEIIYLTFAIPANLIREHKPISDAGFMGPVGIAVTTGEVVQSAVAIKSTQPIIWFMALLSAALGLTNLLPLPALDGGRLLFIVVEALRRGKRIQPAQEGMVHLIGFGLLLLLMGLLTIKEISALINHTFPSLGIR
jgi:regulator of sigma E protease